MTTVRSPNTSSQRIRKVALPFLAAAMLVVHRIVWRPGGFPDLMAILTVPLIAVLLFIAARRLLGYEDERHERIELPPLPPSGHDGRSAGSG